MYRMMKAVVCNQSLTLKVRKDRRLALMSGIKSCRFEVFAASHLLMAICFVFLFSHHMPRWNGVQRMWNLLS